MSDYIPIPNVKNVYYNKPLNFTLVIYAYRLLTKAELLQAAEIYKVQRGWSLFPQNAKHKCFVTRESLIPE